MPSCCGHWNECCLALLCRNSYLPVWRADVHHAVWMSRLAVHKVTDHLQARVPTEAAPVCDNSSTCGLTPPALSCQSPKSCTCTHAVGPMQLVQHAKGARVLTSSHHTGRGGDVKDDPKGNTSQTRCLPTFLFFLLLRKMALRTVYSETCPCPPLPSELPPLSL